MVKLLKANAAAPFPQIEPLTFLFEGSHYVDDVMYGTSYADEMYGLGGNDTLYSNGGNDLIYGGYGDDRLFGGAGSDLLDGGYGDDVLEGGAGADRLGGGPGSDTASYRGAMLGVTLDLGRGGVTNDAAGDTYLGIENVWGSNFADIIQGDAQNNRIDGYSGNDYLFGGAGNDRLDGGEGNDTLRGGAGDDILIGNSNGSDRMTGDDAGGWGYDTFVFEGFRGSHVVTDFQRGYDKIDLRNIANNFGDDGRLAIGSDSRGWSNLDGDAIAYNVDTHTVNRVEYWNIDGVESIRFVEMGTLEGVNTLSASDFV